MTLTDNFARLLHFSNVYAHAITELTKPTTLLIDGQSMRSDDPVAFQVRYI